MCSIIIRNYNTIGKSCITSKLLHENLTTYFKKLKVPEPEISSSYLIASVVDKETVSSSMK